ncbi:MAG TPA: hypothetical protein VK680_05620 [Solirubrobacteraceae bacterium]|nr:hypothetical protein [Solirubrobacteraceae bacterium]
MTEREEAHPQIKLISIGTANYFAGAAAVPVEFYGRDKFPSHGSDTQCRLFNGAITMVHVGSQWQYEPAASHLVAVVVPPGSANCPG